MFLSWNRTSFVGCRRLKPSMQQELKTCGSLRSVAKGEASIRVSRGHCLPDPEFPAGLVESICSGSLEAATKPKFK